MMKAFFKLIFVAAGLFAVVLMAGCGASKTYVDQAVADERANREASVSGVAGNVAENKAILERLQSLTTQLEKKTDIAINQAKGFEDYIVVWEGEIFFDFNSSEINMAASEFLDQAGDKMVASRTAVMEIAGYTDPSGSAAYNMTLGQKRGAAAKYYLVDNYGINLYRLFFVSHGETKAVAGGDGQVSYGEQRKAILKLWDKP
ncbi:MAG: OmpA family protein [FCB group bacterium]|nr:OmpA family protein [FCB group bacterium]